VILPLSGFWDQLTFLHRVQQAKFGRADGNITQIDLDKIMDVAEKADEQKKKITPKLDWHPDRGDPCST